MKLRLGDHHLETSAAAVLVTRLAGVITHAAASGLVQPSDLDEIQFGRTETDLPIPKRWETSQAHRELVQRLRAIYEFHGMELFGELNHPEDDTELDERILDEFSDEIEWFDERMRDLRGALTRHANKNVVELSVGMEYRRSKLGGGSPEAGHDRVVAIVPLSDGRTFAAVMGDLFVDFYDVETDRWLSGHLGSPVRRSLNQGFLGAVAVKDGEYDAVLVFSQDGVQSVSMKNGKPNVIGKPSEYDSILAVSAEDSRSIWIATSLAKKGGRGLVTGYETRIENWAWDSSRSQMSVRHGFSLTPPLSVHAIQEIKTSSGQEVVALSVAADRQLIDQIWFYEKETGKRLDRTIQLAGLGNHLVRARLAGGREVLLVGNDVRENVLATKECVLSAFDPDTGEPSPDWADYTWPTREGDSLKIGKPSLVKSSAGEDLIAVPVFSLNESFAPYIQLFHAVTGSPFGERIEVPAAKGYLASPWFRRDPTPSERVFVVGGAHSIVKVPALGLVSGVATW